MTPERWKIIEDILQDALNLPLGERENFIHLKSGGDDELIREIKQLIAETESDENFLESPVWSDSLLLQSGFKRDIASSLEEKTHVRIEDSFIGKRVGVYRLTKELGRGGMGVVYLAERDDGEFKQKVAIKLIKRGMDTDFVLRRFRQERQIAAALNHPNIARLLDGGATSDGLPYFVMEYVEGEPVFKYAQINRLDLKEKLELFLQICRAVYYAHTKHIIHRDIKPGNILVAGDEDPKLLDFGIAKILDPDLIDESAIPTQTQMRLMTPEYASPEQVRGDEISGSSDQYSLGVLLYELLTGTRPYKFPSRAPHEIARVICDEMPSAPSSGEFGQMIAENAELSLLDREFYQKLDRIVLKSLRKNPSERYSSVKEFAADIERFLKNENIHAELLTGNEESPKTSSINLQTSSGQTEAETRTLPENPKRSKARNIKYALAAILLLFFGYGIYHVVSNSIFDFSGIPSGERWKNKFGSLNSKRLTTNGKASMAALSPNGEQIAFVSVDADGQSLWLGSTDSDNAQQIVAPEQGIFGGVKFSPDEKFIYYHLRRGSERMLYRVLAQGGTPEKVLTNVHNSFAFSPDGQRLIYDYQDPNNKQYSLFIAELYERSYIKSTETLFVLDAPNFFPGGFSFSPDGTKIIYPRTTIAENKFIVNLFVYDLENRTNVKLGERDFDDIRQTAWRKNGEEIVFSASEKDSAPHQLWLVNYPSGEISRLTNDFTDYSGVSLSADTSMLVTTKSNSVSSVWTSELSVAPQNFEAKTKQITSGINRQDGVNGVNWTRDGRILYISSADARHSINLMNADGSDIRTIPTGSTDPSLPSLTTDNRFLIYADRKEQEYGVWRYDMNNGTAERISDAYAVTPSLAADDRSIFYSTLNSGAVKRLSVHRQSFDGDEKTALTDEFSFRPVSSPDNRFVAANYIGNETKNIWQIAILSLNRTIAPRFLEPYANNFFRNSRKRPLAWSPDSRFLYFLNDAGGTSNIFRIALEGDQTPVPMTHFTAGEIFDFALSSDGKSFIIARGSTPSDIVIFRNSK